RRSGPRGAGGSGARLARRRRRHGLGIADRADRGANRATDGANATTDPRDAHGLAGETTMSMEVFTARRSAFADDLPDIRGNDEASDRLLPETDAGRARAQTSLAPRGRAPRLTAPAVRTA